MSRARRVVWVISMLAAASGTVRAAQSDAPLPPGVKAVWDPEKAFVENTPTRGRICLNGLWRWQPAREGDETIPAGGWGFFKVPGAWPGLSSYDQEDSQAVIVHPDWKNQELRRVTAAWYQREISVPAGWAGRRISLRAEILNSYAVAFVDGKKAGELRYPAGELDLTSACRPGARHLLSLVVTAMPLKAVMLSYSDTNAAREVKGSVARRGLCGDLFLVGTPAAARIDDVRIETSVKKGEIAFDVALLNLVPTASYALRAEIREEGRIIRECMGAPFKRGDLKEGRIAFMERWKPSKLWDLHTPQNVLTAQVSLAEVGGGVLDLLAPIRFGFREFRIEGRDFFLNGTRIFLSAVPLDNAQLGARAATYGGARETLRRLRGFGINFVYTHNYGCEPGTHVGFEEILRAADDAGMLVAFSQPHFGQYDWRAPDADAANGYARHAEYYVRAAQNHPSVVAYSMSHNATGYDEDMNPDLIDGVKDPRKDGWSRNNAGSASRAEAIVRSLDPGRIIYHHSSGNLGSMHTSNFYVNFTPIQELCDWFEHWATEGVKPMFPVEYGVPFSWDWTQYRGWFKGNREWGSAKVPWEYCLAEWNAQFLGDRAFQLTELEKRNVRWEAAQFRAGNLWHRWDYPAPPGSAAFEEQQAIYAMYLTDTWRAFRTWGLSANSPWEYGMFWKLRDGVDRARKPLKVDWENLQVPGFSPDHAQPRNGVMGSDFESSDWTPTAAGRALIRNNGPVLAHIAGKAGRFTGKDHIFLPGETVEKQLILINNSRETVSFACDWTFGLSPPIAGRKEIAVRTGEQERIPLRFELPGSLAPGTFEIRATVKGPGGVTQTDSFAVHVVSRPSAPPAGKRIALFDPRGETAKRLSGLKVELVSVDADLSPYDVLIVGREALTREGPGPEVGRVREGLKVILFEQTAKVLEERFGFRVAEYGLRRVFSRVPGHPLLSALDGESLRDWRGEATLLPARLKYELRPRYGPTIRWCGLEVPQAWRCGGRGNVASVLIEKPARGDFMPILDGGYGLQYSPLLEYREGKGLVLFCQADVSGRTEGDPAADLLVRNLLHYVSDWKPAPRRMAVYAGDSAGRAHLESAGFVLDGAEEPSPDRVLIAGAGGGKRLAAWLEKGGRALAIGLGAEDLELLKIPVKKGEHLSAYFEPGPAGSAFAGIGPADVHNRDPRELPLVAGGVGNGVLAKSGNLVLCQIAPWQFDPKKQLNLKRTFRRSACLVARLVSNAGVAGSTPLLARFRNPVDPAQPERRWLEGLYLDVPEEWDFPYRYFRW